MILFVTLNSDTANNPTIASVMDALKKNKAGPVLFSLVPQKFELSIPVVQVKINFNSRFDVLLKFFVVAFKAFKLLINDRPNVIIGIDPEGIIVASAIHRLNKLFGRSRLHYWSFEIFAQEEGFRKKSQEIKACEYVSHLLIQDESRFQILCAENNLKPGIVKTLIPVSYPDDENDLSAFIPGSKGQANTSEYPQYSASDLKPPAEYSPDDSRGDFKSPRECLANKKPIKIIVWGTIAQWSGLDWLANLEVPDGISLVVHSRFKLERDNRAYRALNARANVSIHNEYIDSHSESLRYLREFDFGLCLYLPEYQNICLGKNLEFIGLSSGKFAMFTQAGLPVIANNPFHIQMIEKYQCGFNVSSLNQLQGLLKKIGKLDREKIKWMGKNSRLLYESMINPKKIIEEYARQLSPT